MRSYRLRMVCISSTEDEIVGLSDSATYVLWYRVLLAGFKEPEKGPTVVYQDNQSAMIMHKSGGSFSRSKHIFIRGCYVKEHLENGSMTLVYCPTENMLADIGTKSLNRAQFEKIDDKLYGTYIKSWTCRK